MGGGGDRPKNHIPARFVTVVDRAQGCIKYFCLDQKGTLVYENGEPKLDKTEPFRPTSLTVCLPRTVSPAFTSPPPMPVVAPEIRVTEPPQIDESVSTLSDETYEYKFWGPDDDEFWM